MGTVSSAPRLLENTRCSARIPFSLPIVLRGIDSAGKSFIEQTQTVVINRRGAKALTKHSLILGASLQVAVPQLKRASSAKVAWAGDPTGEYQEVGIDLGQIGDFWGVPIPDDSRSGVTTPAEQVQAVVVSAPPAPRPSAAPPEAQNGISDRLLSALQVTQAAIEESLVEVFQQLARQARESLTEMQRVTIEHTREHLHRASEDAGREFEIRVTEVVARTQQVCGETLQRMVQAAQEQLEVSLVEHQARLADNAKIARRELARTLADLSGTLGRD